MSDIDELTDEEIQSLFDLFKDIIESVDMDEMISDLNDEGIIVIVENEPEIINITINIDEEEDLDFNII